MKFTINLSEFINFIRENKSIDEFIRVKVIEFIKWLIEVTLETQIEMLREGYKSKGRRQRNGYYERSLLTRFGLIEKIKVPRLRGMRFHNLVFNKWQRRLESFDRMITMLFTQGKSYRDIQRVVKEHFYEPFAIEVFKKDDLIKTKFSFDLHLHHLINTTMPIDRTFREVRRRTNPIGCFENIKSADKILALIVEHINVELFGNASFTFS